MGKIVPDDWMPKSKAIKRVVFHWTAGAGSPSSEDKDCYHFLLDRVGHIHRGDHSILDNVSTTDGDYAAHTRGLNTGSIGLALCGMAGANQEPFAPGKYPLTVSQWNAALIAMADICRRYDIEPDRRGLLMHCEVQKVYNVAQRGKFDISVRTWPSPERWASLTPGDEMRARVALLLKEG